jgi:hypothetical protein
LSKKVREKEVIQTTKKNAVNDESYYWTMKPALKWALLKGKKSDASTNKNKEKDG